MPGRRLLVIGTQCRSLAELSFLPQLAQDLHGVLSDPALGACDTARLLLDPTVAELDSAVDETIFLASAHEETLIIAVIGHGEYADDDFYVMARDSSCPANSARAYLLAQRIKEAIREYSLLDGLVLLLDTCHAGLATAQAAASWVDIIGMAGRRFEILTASDESIATGGCFSRTLTTLLRQGHPDLRDRIHCEDLKHILTTSCPRQTAQHLSFTGTRAVGYSDQASWLAHNAARTPAGLDAKTAARVSDLTRWYVPTRVFGDLRRRLNQPDRSVTLSGPSGSGKSALLAALRVGTDPLLDAIAFPSATDTTDTVAALVADQLTHAVPGFSTSAATATNLAAQLRQAAPQRIRIGLDTSPASSALVEQLTTDPNLGHVQLITVISESADIVLDVAEPDDLDRYFQLRDVTETERKSLIEVADGDWATARATADLAHRGRP